MKKVKIVVTLATGYFRASIYEAKSGRWLADSYLRNRRAEAEESARELVEEHNAKSADKWKVAEVIQEVC